MKTFRLTSSKDSVEFFKDFLDGKNVLVANDITQISDGDFIFTLSEIIDSGNEGFVLASFDEAEQFVGFCVAYSIEYRECGKVFRVYMVYAKDNNDKVLKSMQEALESFLDTLDIASYEISTKRFSTAAERCFIKKYNFRKSFVVYTKEVIYGK